MSHPAVPPITGGMRLKQGEKSPMALYVVGPKNPQGRMIGHALSVEWAKLIVDATNRALVNKPTDKKEEQ